MIRDLIIILLLAFSMLAIGYGFLGLGLYWLHHRQKRKLSNKRDK